MNNSLTVSVSPRTKLLRFLSLPRSGQRLAVSLHGLRERRGRLPHPLHDRPLAGGEAAVLDGARPGPVQQCGLCQCLGHGTCPGRGRLWSGTDLDDNNSDMLVTIRLVHLDVEDCSEELLRQQFYAIKNQQGASTIPPNGGILRSQSP